MASVLLPLGLLLLSQASALHVAPRPAAAIRRARRASVRMSGGAAQLLPPEDARALSDGFRFCTHPRAKAPPLCLLYTSPSPRDRG